MPGFLRRSATYFTVMFPLHAYLPFLAVLYFGFIALAQATASRPVRFEPGSLFGFATLVLSFLLLRLMDELKDEGVDAQVFPDRPLVTGAVRYDDVRILALLSLLGVLALNVGRGIATQFYFAWFVFFVLSWQWWLFPRRVSQNVWLVFATHQPLVPLLFAYVYAAYVEASGAPFAWNELLSLCTLYWIPFFAWEIARKVRAPQDETSYLTYTKRWGTRLAAMIPPLCIGVGCAATVALGLAAGLSRGFTVVHLAAAALAIASMLSFLWHPRRAALLVRAPMETYMFIYCVAPIVDALLERAAS